MICRLWRGWTTPDNADTYEGIVRGEVIPGIEARKIPGFRHIDLMRRDFTMNAMAVSLKGADLGRLVDPFGHHWEIGHPLA